MSTSTRLDRRLNHLQFNVQSEINILDDKIQFFAKYYQELQSEISQQEDEKNRLEIRGQQIMHSKKGKLINKRTDRQTLKSKIIKDYEKIRNEIELHHELELKALKEDFESTYEEIDKRAEQMEIEKMKPVDEEIKRTLDLIKKMKTPPPADNSIDEAAEQEIERTHELEGMRIQSLEAKLKEQNQDRLSTLLDAKRQLQECVHTLEEMENAHINKMEQLRDELDNMDNSYKEKVKRNYEKHKKDTVDIKRNIKDMQEKARTVSKSINQAEKRQKKDILKVAQESETLRVELLAVKKKETQKREGDNDIKNYQKQLSELNSKLRERESILMKVRSDNETLKKEIARVSQERQIAQRRAALHIV